MVNPVVVSGVDLVDESLVGSDVSPEVGQWYWVRGGDYRIFVPGEPSGVTWFGCCVGVGSNYIRLQSPKGNVGECSIRVHVDDIAAKLIYEPNHDHFLQAAYTYHQSKANELIAEVKCITEHLGVSTQLSVPSGSNSLVVMSESSDITRYEDQLVVAKDETLPGLLEELKDQNELVCFWLTAGSLAMLAQSDNLLGCIGEVEKRIFNVSLYAGLTESVIELRGGEQGNYGAQVHLMQRRLYMDEECLLRYEGGGMEFGDIGQFDEWLLKEANVDRLLPFSKCIVTFRVRRDAKVRKSDGTLLNSFIDFNLAEGDKTTYMYIRNGECLYRMNCGHDFGENVFPDAGVFDPSEPMMITRRFSQTKLMSVREWEDRKDKSDSMEIRKKAWVVDNPEREWCISNNIKYNSSSVNVSWRWANPEHNSSDLFDSGLWQPFDDTNVYYDDALKTIEADIDCYNRVALIIQGLLDRSEILHPHPKVCINTAEGSELLKLVFDNSNVLHDGDAPDIQAYFDKCNALADGDSIFIGQHDQWQANMIAQENERRENDWRCDNVSCGTDFTPHGNAGPGVLARCSRFSKKNQTVTFAWLRERQAGGEWLDPTIRTTFTADLSLMFNVSAYKKGDYLQFFKDPRTRQEYLKWAPYLLAAEDLIVMQDDTKVRNPAKKKGE